MKKMKLNKLRLLPFAMLFVSNIFSYSLPMLLLEGFKHYDLTCAVDAKIPLVPQFVFIYIAYFLFWVCNYYIISADSSKETFYRFVTADLLMKSVSLCFFVFFPTTMARPELLPEGISGKLLMFIFSVDKPTNLFPSVHCMTSFICCYFILKNRDFKMSFKAFTLIFTILIMASTVLIKQHVAADVFSGLFLSVIICTVSDNTRLYESIMKLYDKAN